MADFHHESLDYNHAATDPNTGASNPSSCETRRIDGRKSAGGLTLRANRRRGHDRITKT